MIDPLDFLGLLVPPGFVRYCGSCGAVWGGCGCAELVARKQVVEAAQPPPVAEPDAPTAKEETWRDRPGML